jgi:hypothetical protein
VHPYTHATCTGTQRQLLSARVFCAVVLLVCASYWLRVRLNSLFCDDHQHSGASSLALLNSAVTYFARTYVTIKVVGWCVAKIRRPLCNVLSNTPRPFAPETQRGPSGSTLGEECSEPTDRSSLPLTDRRILLD